MNAHSGLKSEERGGSRWYDLFSRGARDWLRHNEKVRAAVRAQLPELVSQADIVESDGHRRVQVPVRMLEHYRFRLAPPNVENGVGQGKAKPGDTLRPAQRPGPGTGRGGGSESGGVEFILELTVEDIVDWLWEELHLPNLESKTGGIEQDEYTREGWDRRGARSRLDRRRSLKEAIKRRAVQKDGPAFTDDDLRFRQLVKREHPASEAVVFFIMDVSASMGRRERQLAKTFFFWVVQGLRRQYTHLHTVFVAHTDQAWEFGEAEFFQVKGSGGTVASSAFQQVLRDVDATYSPSRFNVYAFYASDGENFSNDHEPALLALNGIAEVANYVGFLQTGLQFSQLGEATEMAQIFSEVHKKHAHVGTYFLDQDEKVWDAIRSFFSEQAAEPAES